MPPLDHDHDHDDDICHHTVGRKLKYIHALNKNRQKAPRGSLPGVTEASHLLVLSPETKRPKKKVFRK